MSEPRDLRLERLDGRDGRRHPYLGEAAVVGSALAGASRTRASRAAYEALIDAVFTAPGASAWLSGLRRAIAAMLAEKDSAVPASSAAICTASSAPRP
jgi:hypothetical protein